MQALFYKLALYIQHLRVQLLLEQQGGLAWLANTAAYLKLCSDHLDMLAYWLRISNNIWWCGWADPNALLLFLPHSLQGLHQLDITTRLLQWNTHQLYTAHVGYRQNPILQTDAVDDSTLSWAMVALYS